MNIYISKYINDNDETVYVYNNREYTDIDLLCEDILSNHESYIYEYTDERGRIIRFPKEWQAIMAKQQDVESLSKYSIYKIDNKTFTKQDSARNYFIEKISIDGMTLYLYDGDVYTDKNTVLNAWISANQYITEYNKIWMANGVTFDNEDSAAEYIYDKYKIQTEYYTNGEYSTTSEYYAMLNMDISQYSKTIYQIYVDNTPTNCYFRYKKDATEYANDGFWVGDTSVVAVDGYYFGVDEYTYCGVNGEDETDTLQTVILNAINAGKTVNGWSKQTGNTWIYFDSDNDEDKYKVYTDRNLFIQNYYIDDIYTIDDYSSELHYYIVNNNKYYIDDEQLLDAIILQGDIESIFTNGQNDILINYINVECYKQYIGKNKKVYNTPYEAAKTYIVFEPGWVIDNVIYLNMEMLKEELIEYIMSK